MPPTPDQPETKKGTLRPWLSILAVLIIAVIAWAYIAQKAKPNTQKESISTINQPPLPPTLALPQEQRILKGAVTFIQDTNLTVMVLKEDNPTLEVDKALIVSISTDTKITDKEGGALTLSALKAGGSISVYSKSPLTNESAVIPADIIVINP
ncbi:hypothetical protein A3I42_00615 [Candidatus Uhrbacteria bacterium RIFCSPLOWO2_02_FULL_49_11]|uniref:DUF5666 domain-containing protein n=1 Tax=Candidatus Uhrbacteria bacterium RIFCSPLOWO2_02_FULL_49_11 TaxID=1802409 RepID=A0A1F7VDM7_9BACT|nr:MAG: hypothetical protein A3I42_00615 [Candidatus Uhrbacteria bacterium RIFCSPLOWO2_02_FULL_49_11]